jgi:hypothetical protein
MVAHTEVIQRQPKLFLSNRYRLCGKDIQQFVSSHQGWEYRHIIL